MKKHFITIVMGTTLFAASVTPADSFASEHKWEPHIDLEGKLGSKRSLGEADLFVPLWQNAETLFFGSLRGRIDDDNGREGNYGIALRHMLDNGWNLGGYTYYDHRKSPFGNRFNQVTVGMEALSLDWDFRVNTYIPVGRTKRNEDTYSRVEFSGSTISYRAGEERALDGFDAEIGWRVPFFDADADQQLRVYVGGYRFTDSKVDTVSGPRGRIDYTISKLPYLWEGSRLTLAAEIQHDDPRGTQSFASLRLRIPLGGKSSNSSNRLNAMERRMADPIIRDIDVVTQAGTFGTAEKITRSADGNNLKLVSSDTILSADLASTIASAGTNSTVVLNGSFADVNSRLDVQNGQTIMGAGNLDVKTPSGRTVTITTPGASLSGAGGTPALAGSPNHIFNMADNSRLVGVTVSTSAAGATTAIRINGVNNVEIINNTITGSATGNTSFGIQLQGDAQNTVIRGNTITSTSNHTFAYALAATGSNNLVFENNTLNVSGATNNHLIIFNGDNTNLSGSGNSGNVSTCNVFGGTNTGSISFTTALATTCP